MEQRVTMKKIKLFMWTKHQQIVSHLSTLLKCSCTDLTPVMECLTLPPEMSQPLPQGSVSILRQDSLGLLSKDSQPPRTPFSHPAMVSVSSWAPICVPCQLSSWPTAEVITVDHAPSWASCRRAPRATVPTCHRGPPVILVLVSSWSTCYHGSLSEMYC